MPTVNYKNFSVSFHREVAQDIDDLVDETGVSRGMIVRLAVQKCLGEVAEVLRSGVLPPDPLKKPLRAPKDRPVEKAPLKSAEPPPPLAAFLQGKTFATPQFEDEHPAKDCETVEEHTESAAQPMASAEISPMKKRRRG